MRKGGENGTRTWAINGHLWYTSYLPNRHTGNLFSKEKKEVPSIASVFSVAISHLYHHRGQLLGSIRIVTAVLDVQMEDSVWKMRRGLMPCLCGRKRDFRTKFSSLPNKPLGAVSAFLKHFI